VIFRAFVTAELYHVEDQHSIWCCLFAARPSHSGITASTHGPLSRHRAGTRGRGETQSHTLRRTRDDGRRVHDHVHGSRGDFFRNSSDAQGTGALHGHHGLDSGFVPVGLLAIPDSGWMAGRQDRPAAGSQPDCGVVERVHFVDGVVLGRGLITGLPVSIRNR